MSNIALVMVEAIQARIGDADIWPEDYNLFTENVQSDDVLIVRPYKYKEGERAGLSWIGKGGEKTIEVIKPFWAFRLTPIGDWLGSFTNGVSDVADAGGWDSFQDDVDKLVRIAKRIQQESIPEHTCPFVNFIVAYQYVSEVNHTYEGDEYDSWCELMGEVDLDKVPQIIKEDQ